VIIIQTIFCSLLIVLGGIFNPYSRFVSFLGQLWVRTIISVTGTKLEVKGLENIDKSRSYIFISNHQSHLDVPVVFKSIPVTVRFLAKKELFKIPIFGWAIHAAGMIKIDRSNSKQAQRSINDALSIIQQGVSVVVFSEGTRSEDGVLRQFKKGGFVLAIKGGIPIIPVSISGSHLILKKHSIKIQRGRIKLVFDSPIETKDFFLEKRDELIGKVRGIIEKNIDMSFNNPDA
jgi:1-acyl-sn-glycerol-3-phosphate acyltransferase